MKKIAKCGIVDEVIKFAQFKETSKLKKLDGKKQVKLRGIPKPKDANKAGVRILINVLLFLLKVIQLNHLLWLV